MKILLMGGTGTMGKYLISLLSKNIENEIYVTTRRELHWECDRVHSVSGNAKKIDFVQKLMREYGKWDVIVDFMIYSLAEFSERIDLLLGNTAQYVFLSSARVYADSNEIITESTPRLKDVSKDEQLLKSNNYAITKARQEDLLLSYPTHNWTIVRPYITYSDSKLQFGAQEKEEWLYRILHNRSILVPNDIMDKTTTMTWGSDVAKAIASLFGVDAALGETFNIAQDKSEKWSENLSIYREYLEELGYKVKVFPIERAEQISSNPYKLSCDRLLNRAFSSEKLKKISGFSEFTDNRIGIQKSLEDFQRNPSFLGINWLQQAKMDRIAKESAKRKEIPSFREWIKYCIIRYVVPFSYMDRAIKKLK